MLRTVSCNYNIQSKAQNIKNKGMTFGSKEKVAQEFVKNMADFQQDTRMYQGMSYDKIFQRFFEEKLNSFMEKNSDTTLGELAEGIKKKLS